VAETQLDQARTAWNEFDLTQLRSVAWLAIPSIGKQVYSFPPGGSVLNHIDQLLANTFPERRHALQGAAVVCGDMEAERVVFEGMTSVQFADVDGYDLSDKSLERVRPSKFAFHPKISDCNDLILETEQYDLIVAAYGIHHLFNIGGLFFQMNKALRPGGVLFINEWVGPERLQIPASNAFFSRVLLTSLFSRRERTTHENRVKGNFLQYGPDFFEPSEACNSAEIEVQLERYFTILSKLEYGALCYPMFEGLGRNFDDSSKADTLRMDAVLRIERHLTSARMIQPLFLAAIAQKKPVWK
jgi:SAM-dependent methyltransferase